MNVIIGEHKVFYSREKTLEVNIMRLSREEVLHISRLARLGLTETEIARLREQLSDILENFEILQQVDTGNVPPTAQSIALRNVLRNDEVAPSLPPGEILTNAPRKEGDCFRVRAVLE
jgi:aspartyl-tRNA(Asn)/glutamyl-tRNA(Gln) amidotransferase subunit C